MPLITPGMQVTGMEEHSRGYAALDQSHGNQKESLKPHQNKIKAGHLKQTPKPRPACASASI